MSTHQKSKICIFELFVTRWAEEKVHTNTERFPKREKNATWGAVIPNTVRAAASLELCDAESFSQCCCGVQLCPVTVARAQLIWLVRPNSSSRLSSASDLLRWALYQKDERGFRKPSIWPPGFAKSAATESPHKSAEMPQKVDGLVLVGWVYHLEIHSLSTGAVSPCKDLVVFCRDERKGRTTSDVCSVKKRWARP